MSLLKNFLCLSDHFLSLSCHWRFTFWNGLFDVMRYSWIVKLSLNIIILIVFLLLHILFLILLIFSLISKMFQIFVLSRLACSFWHLLVRIICLPISKWRPGFGSWSSRIWSWPCMRSSTRLFWISSGSIFSIHIQMMRFRSFILKVWIESWIWVLIIGISWIWISLAWHLIIITILRHIIIDWINLHLIFLMLSDHLVLLLFLLLSHHFSMNLFFRKFNSIDIFIWRLLLLLLWSIIVNYIIKLFRIVELICLNILIHYLSMVILRSHHMLLIILRSHHILLIIWVSCLIWIYVFCIAFLALLALLALIALF